MSTPTEFTPTKLPASQWNYVDVQVMDGQRVLRPTHIAFDRLIFSEPPNLTSRQVEVVVINNGQSHSSQVLVLPHESESTVIPIQLINTDEKSPAKLTA